MSLWLAAAPFLALAASDAAKAERQPTGKWVVDWGEEQCALARDTGNTVPVTVLLNLTPGTGSAQFWVYNAEWKSAHFGGMKPVRILFRPGGERIEANALAAERNGQHGLALRGLDKNFVDSFARAEGLTIEHEGQVLVDIPVKSAGRAVEALRRCIDDQLTGWGIDPRSHASLRRFPQLPGERIDWITSDDYPMDAIKAKASGKVIIRVTVGADGRVGSCHVLRSAGHPSLDRRTCEIFVRRGRYQPALDASGAPTAATIAVPVHWLLPDG